MIIPFLGGSAEARSASINAQKSINCFPVVDNKEPKSILSMYGTPGLKFFAQAVAYGSGVDGAVTISADTTLTRDMQYTTLTVNSGKTLSTAGFTILCSVLLTNNGTITDSTNGGTGGAGGTGYLNEGSAGGDGLIPGAAAGGNGGNGRGSTGVGGTGGKGGGLVRIFANTLTNAGTIHANAAAATASSGEAGDGADGGNGGIVSLTWGTAHTHGTEPTATAGSHSDGVAYGIDASTTLVILASETHGSITPADSSLSPKTIVVGGAVTVDANHSPFSTGGCINFPGATADFLTINTEADDLLGSGDYTIDFQVNADDTPIGVYTLFTCGINTFSQLHLLLQKTASGVIIGLYSYTNSYLEQVYTVVDATLSGFFHVLITRVSTAGKIFINGVLKATGIIYSTPVGVQAPLIKIGGGGSGFNAVPFLGKLTAFRLSTTARETADFTPPPTQYAVAVDGTDGAAGTVTWTNVPNFTFSSAAFRGGIVAGSKLYVCIGANILSITTAGVVTYLGVITTSTGNVFMAYSGTQILITDGTAYGHYIPTATDVLTDITDGDFPSASSCTWIDGYFIVTKTSTGQFYISALSDVTSWSATEFDTAMGSPDNLVRCFQANNNLWLAGETSLEVWYDSANVDFPFERVQGALIEDGLAGAAAICLIRDQLYFLSNKLEVLRTVGYQREKLSTIHLDKEIQSYTTTSDAVIYEYRADGHIFLVLTFPTADKTWVYDTTTDFWHEWQSYITAGTATYARHRGALGFFFNGKYIVGDHSSGTLLELDMATYTDNGQVIKRTRRSQIINKDRVWVLHHQLELDFETGVGIGGTGSGSNPDVSLRWSDDNANTWSTGITKKLGISGVYSGRVLWRRLGKSRNRIYELTMSEPVKFVLQGAYAELEELKA